MQDLRLIGVHEDGQHLLLADGEDGRFRVPLDEPLRAAARRDRPHMGQLQIEIEGGLRPRDVQAMIRGGASAEEVADRAGWTVEKVRRYEGPILAEREHVAGLARNVRLRGRGGAQGSAAPTLAARVGQRLAARGVDPALAEWDSSRTEDGEWTVTVTFPAGGRERQARWRFDVPARTVTAAEDEARWLSEEDASGAASPIPAPHLVSAPVRATTVYDVEAEGGLQASARRKPSQASADAHREDPLDLMSAMRERASARGRRSGGKRKSAASRTPVDDAPREDALPLEDINYDPEAMPEPPAARGAHPEDEQPDERGDDLPAQPAKAKAGAKARAKAAPASAPTLPPTSEPTKSESTKPPAAQSQASKSQGSRSEAPDGVGDDVLPASEDAATIERRIDPPEATADADAETAHETETEAEAAGESRADEPADSAPEAEALADDRPRAAKKNGRTSVPSWDDVMFGARPRD